MKHENTDAETKDNDGNTPLENAKKYQCDENRIFDDFESFIYI